MSVTVELAAFGNIDHGQDPSQPLCGVGIIERKFVSIKHAQKACRNFIKKHNLGGGNWGGGKVSDESGKMIGYISYNGRFWGEDAKDHWPSGLIS